MYKKQDIQKHRALVALMRSGDFCRVSGEMGISKATLWAWLHEEEFLTKLIRMATCHWKRYHKTYSEVELLRVYRIGFVLIWVKIHDRIFAEDS